MQLKTHCARAHVHSLQINAEGSTGAAAPAGSGSLRPEAGKEGGQQTSALGARGLLAWPTPTPRLASGNSTLQRLLLLSL